MMWRYPYYMQANWGWGIVPMILSAVFWVVVVVALVKIFRKQRWEMESEDSALKILRERFAKGEIDKKKFEEMKKDLG